MLVRFFSQMVPLNAENGNFSKIVYAAGGYKEMNKYITTQPLESRKNGFGSKDASRRDEFSNNTATEQYRESIRKENEMLNAQKDKMQARLTQLLATRAISSANETAQDGPMGSTFNYSSQVAQYDIGRTRVTPFDPKSIKDTYYTFSNDRPKRYGSTSKPVSTDMGSSAWDVHYQPPAFGGKSLVKNFFDRSHLGSTYSG
jgi:hypothetical protein